MSYLNRFNSTDFLITNISATINSHTDPQIQANYAGFISVSAVTVYELAIKDIFIEFASKKNKVFGQFVENRLKRINGRIQIDSIKNDHVKQFGEKYFRKFRLLLDQRETTFFNINHISIKVFYNNLINCRHEFVHKGAPTLTVNEVINYYNYGKEIIHCLNDAMKR